jgi:hypothetical protein
LTLAKFNTASSKKTITPSNLVADFLHSKKNRITSHSLARYRNYYTRVEQFFHAFFPAVKRREKEKRPTGGRWALLFVVGPGAPQGDVQRALFTAQIEFQKGLLYQKDP